MPYIPPETVEKLREIDLLTYLKNYEPEELIKEANNHYCTKSHDSLKISNGKWNWFSQGIGGASALDYLIKVRGYSFMNAAEILLDHALLSPPEIVKPEEKPREFVLPDKYRNANRCIRYLRSRGISDNIIHHCLQAGKLYESSPYHNAVFLGYDRTGTVRYAFQRGLGTAFRGDIAGSDKRYAFTLRADKPSKRVYLFESAVDLLSFATLIEKSGKDFQKQNLLSLEGVHRPRKNMAESKMPLALAQYLKENPETDEIILCFDNDETGRYAAAMLKVILPEYAVKAKFPPPEYKDVNDLLTGTRAVVSEKSSYTR